MRFGGCPTTQCVEIQLIDDAHLENFKYFHINLKKNNESGDIILINSSGIVYINDSDSKF